MLLKMLAFNAMYVMAATIYYKKLVLLMRLQFVLKLLDTFFLRDDGGWGRGGGGGAASGDNQKDKSM